MRKKVIPSRNKLNEIALASGAKVTDKSGKSFNAAKAKPEIKIPKQARPKRTQNDGPDEGSQLIAGKLEEIGKANAQMMAELKQQIAEIRISMPEPPDSWIIDWVRDENGFTKQTVLTPVYNKKTLN